MLKKARDIELRAFFITAPAMVLSFFVHGSGWPQAQCNSLTIMRNFRQLGRILH